MFENHIRLLAELRGRDTRNEILGT